jgi:hypothetical protein
VGHIPKVANWPEISMKYGFGATIIWSAGNQAVCQATNSATASLSQTNRWPKRNIIRWLVVLESLYDRLNHAGCALPVCGG